MIANLSKKTKTSIDKKILILIIFLLIIIDIILFIVIYLEKLKEVDIEITNYLQSKLINKNTNSIPFFIKIVHFINGIYSPYLIITIMFNFFTVYDCFILSNMLSIDYLISFCLKLLYSKPTYNYLNDSTNNETKITIFYCGNGWGIPSEECIIMVSLYLSLWKIVSKSSMNFNRTQKIIKNLLLISLIVLLLIYNFGILLMGYYFFSHLIFSIITGLIIYLFIFEYYNIGLLIPKQFILFIKNKNILFIILHLIIFIILSIIYIIERFIKKNYKYENCNAKGDKAFSKSGKDSYIDGSYSLVILFLGNIFPILGIIFDIKLIYKGIESNYLQFNFPQEDEVIENGSFGDSISITKEPLWNKTSLFISFLRLIIVLLFFGICFIPYFLVNLETESISIIIFIKFLLPISLINLGLFFFFKPILKIMKLTNYTLDSILDDK